MKNLLFKKEKGFTLVETMISMTIFTVIITVGMGAVLNAMTQHYMAQDMRSAMDGLNFTMEDISRNVRLGNTFHCYPSGTDLIATTSAESCSTGSTKITFNSIAGTSTTYLINTITSPAKIQKIVGGVTYDMTTPDIAIDTSKSDFVVVGAEAGDGLQPVVNIRLVGNVLYKNVNKSNFSLETTVTQRQVDS